MPEDAHVPAPVLAGAALGEAQAGALLVHGRGQSPAYMLEHLVEPLALAGVAYVLPAAAGGSWYPERFSAPLAENEPFLSLAVEACERALSALVEAGIPAERIVLAGFSQGGCLTAELLARHPRRYGGVALMTGALPGAPGEQRRPGAGLDGVRVHLASSTRDEWVPPDAVRATARIFQAAGAEVTVRLTDDPEHHIDGEAVAEVRALLAAAAGR